jgi:hypothetical protein
MLPDVSEGIPYNMKSTDSYGNICTNLAECPDIISKLLASLNVVYAHNELRQFLLGFQKKWFTKTHFWLVTIFIESMLLIPFF